MASNYSNLFPKIGLGGGGGATGERTLTYPNAAKVPRIDARAVRRDMDGNVISTNFEAMHKDLHRDMSGNPLSGKSLATGKTENFPKPGGDGLPWRDPNSPMATVHLPGSAPVGSGYDVPGRGTADPHDAPSKVRTGNTNVPFRSAADRATDMQGVNSDRVLAVTNADLKRGGEAPASPPGFPKAPSTSTPYGTGSVTYDDDLTKRTTEAPTGLGGGSLATAPGETGYPAAPTMQRADRQVADDTRAAQRNADAAPAAVEADTRVAQGNVGMGDRQLMDNTVAAQGNVAMGDRQVMDNTAAARGNIDVGNRAAAANDAAAMGLPVNDAAAGTGFPKPANIGGTDVAGGRATIPGLPDNGFPKPGGDAQTDLGPGVPLESYTMPNGKVGRRPAAQPAGGYAAAGPGGGEDE